MCLQPFVEDALLAIVAHKLGAIVSRIGDVALKNFGLVFCAVFWILVLFVWTIRYNIVL